MNLCDTVEKAIGAHRGYLDPPNEPRPAPVEDARPEASKPPRPGVGPPRSTLCRTRASAWHRNRIAAQVSLERKTVRRYAQAATADDVISSYPRRGRHGIAHYAHYFNQRWNEGCTDSGRLHRELRELGCLGSARSVRRWLEPLPRNRPADERPARSADREPGHHVVHRSPRRPDQRGSPPPQTTAGPLPGVGKYRRSRAGVHQDHGPPGRDGRAGWMDRAEDTELPMIRAFARNLRNDLDAVIQG